MRQLRRILGVLKEEEEEKGKRNGDARHLPQPGLTSLTALVQQVRDPTGLRVELRTTGRTGPGHRSRRPAGRLPGDARRPGALGRRHRPDRHLRSLSLTAPPLIIAIAFGLAMDHELFILARMREARSRSGDEGEAVVTGLRRSGRVVTCAALLLAVVFGAFMTSGFAPILRSGSV